MALKKQAPTGQQLVEVLTTAVEKGILPKNLLGKRVLFTGTLSTKRTDLQKMVRVCGGMVLDSATHLYGRNAYLVVGDTGRHGETAKMRTARSRGVNIISEQEFVAMIKDGAQL